MVQCAGYISIILRQIACRMRLLSTVFNKISFDGSKYDLTCKYPAIHLVHQKCQQQQHFFPVSCILPQFMVPEHEQYYKNSFRAFNLCTWHCPMNDESPAVVSMLFSPAFLQIHSIMQVWRCEFDVCSPVTKIIEPVKVSTETYLWKSRIVNLPMVVCPPMLFASVLLMVCRGEMGLSRKIEEFLLPR